MPRSSSPSLARKASLKILPFSFSLRHQQSRTSVWTASERDHHSADEYHWGMQRAIVISKKNIDEMVVTGSSHRQPGRSHPADRGGLLTNI